MDIFKNGDTVGIFQFESYGMQATLRDIQPTGIEDLSVANALYRPGAIAYIKNYCNRKHGKEEITYLHKDLSTYFKQYLWHYGIPRTVDRNR